MLTAHLAVEAGLLTDVLGERDGELAGRVEISEEEFGKGASALHARVEATDDRRGLFTRGGQHQWFAAHQRQHERLAQSHERIQERRLTAGQL